MRAVRFPYAQSRKAATVGTWELIDGGTSAALPDVHPAWDAGVDIRVSRTLSLDGSTFGEEAGLGDGSRIRLVAGYDCEHARSREFLWTHDVVLPSGYVGTVEFTAPAPRLARSVDLIVGAVLVAAGRNGRATRAKVPGSWLWIDRTPLDLDGGRARFPMEWIDFGASGLPRNAAWILDWQSQDWSATTLGTIRLLFNSKHPAFGKVVKLPDTDPRRAIAIHAARFDVAKQMITAALASNEFIAEAETYAEGSVGYSVRLLIRSSFPHDALTTLRERMVHQFGEFHAQFQSGFGAFDLEIDK